ncbi:RPA-interacting protein isoform X1 [Phymastichus coffea]|uniref:RPA-interacting protein isoform X1 n=1 Tax=Phymastichus coffea TaxID=108790 RepID=UPI00273BF062|nr:RPA-interacting protein isoform X1 [Phymastichus coffea]
MEGQLLSPTNLIKKKTQNAARKIKNGSPKLQEILRQRCRQRMHEKRNELFFKRRPGLIDFSQNEKETLADIIHSEFEYLASMEWSGITISSSKSENSLQKVLSANQHEPHFLVVDHSFDIEEEIEEQWIIEEYQKILWEQKQLSSMFDNDGVICPVCLKNFLYEISNYAVCNCGFKLPIQMGLVHLKHNIQEQINIHSLTCLHAPSFSIFQEGENVSLCLTCTSCDIFTLV